MKKQLAPRQEAIGLPLIGYQLDNNPRSIDPNIFAVEDEAWDMLGEIVEREFGPSTIDQSAYTRFMHSLLEVSCE